MSACWCSRPAAGTATCGSTCRWAGGKLLQQRRHDWMYESEPVAGLAGRRIECARGKVVGGSSSINAMAYVRGNRADYDRWAAAGLTQWSYAHALPYFRRQERWEGGGDAYRGGDGPLATETSRYEDPLCDAYVDAARAAGLPATEDYNGAQQDGFARMQMTIEHGRRCSGAVAYLRPALSRPNLTVEIKALVTRLLFDGARVVGVEYIRHGEKTVVRAEREVILSGGSINSPQLLMLSGIGDPDELGAQRNPGASSPERRRQESAGSRRRARHLRPPRRRPVPAEHAARPPGPEHRAGLRLRHRLRDQPAGRAHRIPQERFEPADSRHPASLHRRAAVRGAPLSAAVLAAFFRRLRVPAGRAPPGIARADPAGIDRPARGAAHRAEPARHRPGLEQHPGGHSTVSRAVASARAAPFIKTEIGPGPAATSDEAIDAHIRATAVTAHHPAGTCRMGTDAMAVVDPELRVRGTEGLRVVDASVFPDLVGGNINAPVVMIAEKAADLIRGRTPLAPATVCEYFPVFYTATEGPAPRCTASTSMTAACASGRSNMHAIATLWPRVRCLRFRAAPATAVDSSLRYRCIAPGLPHDTVEERQTQSAGLCDRRCSRPAC